MVAHFSFCVNPRFDFTEVRTLLDDLAYFMIDCSYIVFAEHRAGCASGACTARSELVRPPRELSVMVKATENRAVGRIAVTARTLTAPPNFARSLPPDRCRLVFRVFRNRGCGP